MKNGLKLGRKDMGLGDLYFVADIGANHNGSIDKAIELIHLAKQAGADAAKFQNFVADKIVSAEGFAAVKASGTHQSSWRKPVVEVYKEASISKDWTEILKNECDEVGVDYFTSPYDFESVDHVDPFVDLYKIGSGDITWSEIIEYIADKGKPVLLATGASSESDVRRAVDLVLARTPDLVLMQCNTNYTGKAENFDFVNLNVLRNFQKWYPDLTLGLSDHTRGHSTVLGSIALGARVIEKHFTDNNDQEGPDHGFAMNPKAWKDMVDSGYELLRALGDGKKIVEGNEVAAQRVQRRCIRVARSMKSGEILDRKDLAILRPVEHGAMEAYDVGKVCGKMLNVDLKLGEALRPEFLKNET